jgi:ribose-phosphate pyrophosphokinase
MLLFALNSSRAFGTAVARRVGIDLASHEERDFEDSEFKLRPLQSVRGQRVAVLQSLHADAALSASDKLCRLAFFIGALKDAGASEVTAVVPYLAFARKDRRTKPRDPITTRYVATMLEGVGLDEIIVMDVHNVAAFENAFRCRKENLPAAGVIAAHFDGTIGADERIVVLSPDAGGVKRVRAFAEALAGLSSRRVEHAFMEKQRSEGAVTGTAFAGDVGDATVIVLDDLVSTGTTLARAAAASLERGARAVHAAVTHGVLAPGAEHTLGTTALESIVVTNTIAAVADRCPGLAAKLTVLDVTAIFATALRER